MTTITKSEFADQLGCARSTISALVSKGLPVCPDGKVDGERALRWIVKSVSGARGGWFAGRRGEGVLERAQGLLRGRKATRRPAGGTPNVSESADSIHAARVQLLEQIATPAEVLKFGRVALRLGCTPEQAYALAVWYACQPCLAVDGIEAEEFTPERFPEPTRAQWTETLGAAIDFDAANELSDAASAPEIGPEAA